MPMLISNIAYRLDGSQANTWKIYLTEGDSLRLRRKPVGRVAHMSSGFWAEYEIDGAQAMTGPFSRLEIAAKVVVQRSYETPAPLLSSSVHDMPMA